MEIDGVYLATDKVVPRADDFCFAGVRMEPQIGRSFRGRLPEIELLI
jgi:hypothetical protein